ncbi:RNA polymerase sigma factor [Pedomonas mirosovicensis]|uniref:RNA polymerase sigma factor n=1 Tax=Pedomonas mirosovicensis TaxID=2908641 RepID=UPI002169F554|nr:sigma-70 family RNA polymerase sigma factor [Pedomonas mirosovicensis]MCH8686519.1 sigma-70 family RNA polymerase sigma factor [Pedomonas mirosovicensis]
MTWVRQIDRWFIDRVHVHHLSHRKFALHLLRNEEDAEEVVQEVYARLMALDDWQRIVDPHAFAMQMIRNIAIERFRRADVVRIDRAVVLHEMDAMDDRPWPDQVTFDRAELRRVARAMTALPQRCREALYLRRIDGLPPSRVAEKMGIAVSTVEKHLVKGLRLLQEALKSTDKGEVTRSMDAWSRRRQGEN